ncbi:probable protein phosphatase 2C 75 [Tanacetum coccineum]
MIPSFITLSVHVPRSMITAFTCDCRHLSNGSWDDCTIPDCSFRRIVLNHWRKICQDVWLFRSTEAWVLDASCSSSVVGRRGEGQKSGVETSGESVVVHPTSSSTAAAAIMSLISIMETPQPPVYGMTSVIGRQREMEDEVSVRTNLCRPEINGFRPVHFFGVFDGHGGRHVSALCKENMHSIMEEELMRVKVIGDESNGGELWRTAINRCFERMDEMALRLCLCGGLGTSSNICRCNPQLSFMGSTAVVSVLTKENIFVANCGDSRAVLCRNGRPIPLSVDHKLSFMGSTAVVSVLTMENIFVANCGDSRAVLCRNGRPIPLSVDHKVSRYAAHFDDFIFRYIN